MESIYLHIRRMLKGVCKEEESRQIAIMIGEHLTGYDEARFLTENATELSEEQEDRLRFYVQRLAEDYPIQYLLGEAMFCGLKMKVDKRVLIPRPETEELVRWIAAEHKNAKSILDIGTGSGCIAIALAKMTEAKVCGIDVSEGALAVARENATRLTIDIEWRKVDILLPQGIEEDEQWSVIVSNPPYIPDSEAKEMERNVLDYEPHTALFVREEEPLVFYKAITAFAVEHLERGGWLYFEINRRYGQEVRALLEGTGFEHVEVRQDQYGNERMVRGQLNR